MAHWVMVTSILALHAFNLNVRAQDIETGKSKAASFIACHGPKGNSQAGMFPVLAGQNERYLYLQLRDYKEGRRKNAMMSPIAAGLERQDMKDLAAYFSKQKLERTGFKSDGARVEAGARKAEESLCAMCHLGGMKGQNEAPRLAGQQPDYVITQLKSFKARERTNDAGSMGSLAQTLSEEDMVNLAHWISNLH